MKLSQWAKQQGISYHTAWRWFNEGHLPVKAFKTKTNTILVESPAVKENGKTVIYARVSSVDQKSDLDKQISRLAQYASQKRILVVRIVSEIGSGLNGHRKKLLKLLADPSITNILVEHKDRLIGLGFDYIKAMLNARGGDILVMDTNEVKDDLVQDMLDVLTSFCARLYGRRAAKNKAKKAMEIIKEVK